MSQTCIHLDFTFPPCFHQLQMQNPSTMGVDDELEMMSTAFSMRDAMVQSTINSQCGQLQSARSHAIKSKFQARFSSAFDVVCL